MAADDLSQENNEFAGSIEVDPIADKLGIPRDQGRQIAAYLSKIKWAEVSFAKDKPELTLTDLGYEEIAKLRWNPLRRWLDRHGTTVWMGALSAVVASLVVEFLKRRFWP